MRRKRTRDIIIDLTSLLDVVMILIFALMINNSQLVEASQNELTTVQEENIAIQKSLAELEGVSDDLVNALAKLEEGEIEDLLEQLQYAENRLASYEYMDDIVVIFNIGLENKYGNTERYLTYGNSSDKDSNSQFPVKRNEDDQWSYAVNSLKIALSEFINEQMTSSVEDKYIYLVFTVDESKIYANDFYDIDKALNEVVGKDETGKVRYRLEKLDE